MPISQVFSNTLDPNQVNLSSRFTGATGFFIYAPFLVDNEIELSIDCFVQVYFPEGFFFNPGTELVRNLPLGRITETAILLNRIDTEIVQPIGSDFLNTEIEMALLFLASEPVYLEAFTISPTTSLQTIKIQLTEMQTTLDDLDLRLTVEVFRDTLLNSLLFF